MKFVSSFTSHNGVAEWQRRELYEWATDLFMVPAIDIKYRIRRLSALTFARN